MHRNDGGMGQTSVAMTLDGTNERGNDTWREKRAWQWHLTGQTSVAITLDGANERGNDTWLPLEKYVDLDRNEKRL